MTASEARAASIDAKFKGVDPVAQRQIIDGLITSAVKLAKYECEFSGLHPTTRDGLIEDGFNLSAKEGGGTVKISW